MLNVLLHHVRLVVVTIVTVVFLAFLPVLLGGSEYVARSTFLPQVAQGSLSRYSSLAAQFGVNLPSAGSGPGESVPFYAELLESRLLLEAIASTSYQFASGNRERSDTLEGTIIDLYGIDGDTRQEKLRSATEFLEEQVSVSTDLSSGVITLETRSHWPELSILMNRRLLDLLSEFNLHRRQSQAAAERAFTEDRLNEARNALHEAEEELQSFLQQNRTYQSSPHLVFEAGRLQRRVDLRQQVYGSLAQAHEQARIEEVRTTPVITIVDPPEGSAKAERGLFLRGIFSLILGGTLGIFFAFIKEYLKSSRTEKPEEYMEFNRLRRSALRRLMPAGFGRRDS